jgi:hypothetical protein
MKFTMSAAWAAVAVLLSMSLGTSTASASPPGECRSALTKKASSLPTYGRSTTRWGANSDGRGQAIWMKDTLLFPVQAKDYTDGRALVTGVFFQNWGVGPAAGLDDNRFNYGVVQDFVAGDSLDYKFDVSGWANVRLIVCVFKKSAPKAKFRLFTGGEHKLKTTLNSAGGRIGHGGWQKLVTNTLVVEPGSWSFNMYKEYGNKGEWRIRNQQLGRVVAWVHSDNRHWPMQSKLRFRVSNANFKRSVEVVR